MERISQFTKTQEVGQKRKKLREILPADLQLEFVQERPEKERWDFQGELMKRRHSQIDEDKMFYEAIRAIKREDTGEIEAIQEKSRERREEITQNLKDYFELRLNMNRFLDEGRPDLAGEIAIALNDLDSARKAMKRCFNIGWPDLAGKIALALNDLDSAREAMKRCFNIGWPGAAGRIALALAQKFSFLPETERLLERNNKLKAGIYGIRIITHLLEENQDLGLFKKEYLPRHQFIKQFARETNERIEESKRWQDPEEFFTRHNLDIANLHLIDLNLATQLLRNHISRGLSFAESYLEIFRPALENPEIIHSIQEYIKTNRNLDGYNLSDLLEISSAYQRMGEGRLFAEIVLASKARNFNELKSELNRKLLRKTAELLGIKAEVSEQEISQWKIKYFANLVTNQEMIKKRRRRRFRTFQQSFRGSL